MQSMCRELPKPLTNLTILTGHDCLKRCHARAVVRSCVWMLRPDMRLERHQRHASSALNHHRTSVPPEPWRVRMCVCEEVRLALVVLRACGRRELFFSARRARGLARPHSKCRFGKDIFSFSRIVKLVRIVRIVRRKKVLGATLGSRVLSN